MPSSILNYALAAAILATSMGCGTERSPTGPGPSVQGPGPVTPPGSTTVRSSTVPASNAGDPGVDRFDVAVSRSGTATVTLTWPNGDFSLQLFATRGECANTIVLITGGCSVLGSTRPGTRPGVVTTPVMTGNAVTIWVLNPDEEGSQPFTVDLVIE